MKSLFGSVKVAPKHVPTFIDLLNQYIPGSTTDATSSNLVHIYRVVDQPTLQNIVTAYVNCELGDGDHDLKRSGDQTNPLILYCAGNVGRLSYINGQFVPFSYQYDGLCTSQHAIQKRMEELLTGRKFGNRLPLERKSVSIPKSLEDLQKFLVKPDNGFGIVQTTVVETHRGGKPKNGQQGSHSLTHSSMYKSLLTTTFDLPSSPGVFIPLNVTGIAPTISDINKLNPDDTLIYGDRPVLRFYPNYFPNAFSMFIHHSELIDMDILLSLIAPYYGGIGVSLADGSLAERISSSISSILEQLEPVSGDTIYLLHMFSETTIEGQTLPTFSLQFGQVKADEATMMLYGTKKRVTGSISPDYYPKKMIFQEGISFEMMCCHTLYGKTCGDGVTVEAANMYSYLTGSTINVLSSDFCCNIRASYVTGFSTRQAPTKNAGTGLGFLSQNRYVESFQSAIISGGKTIEEIYIENINKNFSDMNSTYPYEKENIKNFLSEKLKSPYSKSTLADYYACIFIDKKMNDIDGTLGNFADFINGVLTRGSANDYINDINGNGREYFKEIGSFNIQTIEAEVSEYATSFEKLITSFNNDFYKIFIVNRKADYSEEYQEKIEKGISYVSSIEEKLKECLFVDTCKSRNDDTTSPLKTTRITTENISNNQIDYLNPNNKGDNYHYQSIVFVILSTFLNGVGVTKVLGYSKKVIEEIKTILDTEISCNESEKKTFLNCYIPNANSTLVINENIGHISGVSEFYNTVIKIYNNRENGIHKIRPNNESYRLKCQLKQRINLLKFIVRNHTFMTSLDERQQNVMNLAIVNNTKVTVLQAKFIALSSYTGFMDRRGYHALQTQFGSPIKTPNSSQDEAVPTTQSLPTTLSDDDVYEILPPLDDSEQGEPSEEENIIKTIFDKFYSKVTRFVSFYLNSNVNKVVPVDEIVVPVDEIVNKATEEIDNEIQQTIQDRQREDQPTHREKEIARHSLTLTTNDRKNTTSIISWIGETLRGLYFHSGSKMDDSGGSRKKYKKTKKITRRKNKKSPKRKTIKKRKIPKRNAKTRRQRK
jgi:hypothetical protein